MARLRMMILAGVLAGVGAMAGCGGAQTQKAPLATKQSATENQINPQPRDKVQDGGTLTWPLDDMPPNFNYFQVNGSDQSNFYLFCAYMPTPFDVDATGTPHWDRKLLASDPVLVTDPKQAVTYEINPKAVWSDKTPITWQDFYWQWKALNGSNKAYQVSSTSGYEDIENVARGKDDREVIVTFKRKFADWTNDFQPLYPASTNKDPKIFNEGWKNGPLVTAGPFKLDHIDQTAKTVILVRSDSWWGNPAKLDKIVFRVMEPDAQVDALVNGETDMIDIGADATKFARLKNAPGVEIRTAGGPNFGHITFNGTGAILSDVRVREAIAVSIDRAAIGRALLGPIGMTPIVLNNHIFMTNQVGYQDNSGDVGKFDPAKARQLLDQAGWTPAGTVRKKGGQLLEVSFTIPGGVATSRQVAELVQNMLAQVGVTLHINVVPVNDFFDKYIIPGQFEMTLFSWMGTPYPIGSNKGVYVTPKKNAAGELDVQQNYARIGSPAIDALFDQAEQELDPKKSAALANQADALIWQEVHSITLYQRPEIIGIKKNLANYGAYGFAQPLPYEDIGWLKP